MLNHTIYALCVYWNTSRYHPVYTIPFQLMQNCTHSQCSGQPCRLLVRAALVWHQICRGPGTPSHNTAFCLLHRWLWTQAAKIQRTLGICTSQNSCVVYLELLFSQLGFRSVLCYKNHSVCSSLQHGWNFHYIIMSLYSLNGICIYSFMYKKFSKTWTNCLASSKCLLQ